MQESDTSADSALALADEIFQARKYKSALEEYQKTVGLAKTEFNRSVETEALAQIARMNLLLGNKEEGRAHLYSLQRQYGYKWHGTDLSGDPHPD